MRRHCWRILFCVCLLPPAVVNADDTLEELYESRWQLDHSDDTAAYLAELSQSPASFDVPVDDDDSVLRVTKIRTLSLFTLAGDERSKWFFGINEDGFVGIHFRGFSRSGARSHLDVASLFSAKEDAEGDETD